MSVNRKQTVPEGIALAMAGDYLDMVFIAGDNGLESHHAYPR